MNELNEQLLEAVMHSHTVEVVRYIKEGVLINEGDLNGWTPLHFASSCADADTVRTLLGNGDRKSVV